MKTNAPPAVCFASTFIFYPPPFFHGLNSPAWSLGEVFLANASSGIASQLPLTGFIVTSCHALPAPGMSILTPMPLSAAVIFCGSQCLLPGYFD